MSKGGRDLHGRSMRNKEDDIPTDLKSVLWEITFVDHVNFANGNKPIYRCFL